MLSQVDLHQVEELLGEMQSKAKAREQDEVADRIVSFAGKDLKNTAIIYVLLSNPPRDTEALRIKTATRILKNNPKLIEDTGAMPMLETQLDVINGTTDSQLTKMNISNLLGEMESFNAVNTLVQFLSEGIAIRQATAAIGKIGHKKPEVAIPALIKIKRIYPLDDIVSSAERGLKEIAEKIDPKREFDSGREFYHALWDGMEKAGATPLQSFIVTNSANNRRIQSTSDMTELAMKKMENRFGTEKWRMAIRAIPGMKQVQ